MTASITSILAESTTDAAELRARIDRSCRAPVLVFFVSSIVWLLVGTGLGMLASIKLHSPRFWADVSWLSFGRVRPAHLDVEAYGWGAMAGIGCLIWMMCRLCRVEARWPQALIAAGILWNAGVLSGTVFVLTGRSTGIEWIEFPTSSAFLLFVAMILLGVWTILTIATRRQAGLYVSQWYLFASVFWFPWVYATAQILCIVAPAAGVAQESVHWWFGHNVLGVFFTPIGLATLYYMIPKVLNRPVHSYALSLLGFWTLAMFYTWAGGHHLVSGPVPAWLVTVSIVSSMMMFVPVLTTAVNLHMTTRGRFGEMRSSPTLAFMVFGGMAYTLSSVQGSLHSLRVLNEPVHFTHYTIGHAHLGLYGFYTMVMFGAMYYIVPKLSGRAMEARRAVKAQFWLAALGLGLMFVSLSAAGVIQGIQMNFTRLEWVEIVRKAIPWLHVRSASGIMLAASHVVFAWIVLKNVVRQHSRPTADCPLPTTS